MFFGLLLPVQRIHDNFFSSVSGGLGVIFGVFGEPLVGFWEPFGVFWEPLGGMWLFFFGFCVCKRETVKSVVLLNEIDVLRGEGGVG